MKADHDKRKISINSHLAQLQNVQEKRQELNKQEEQQFAANKGDLRRRVSITSVLFSCPPVWMIGGILYLSCPSVYFFVSLSVVNFNIRNNFWTVGDRDLIFGMHTQLPMPFQMVSRLMTLWPWLWPLF